MCRIFTTRSRPALLWCFYLCFVFKYLTWCRKLLLLHMAYSGRLFHHWLFPSVRSNWYPINPYFACLWVGKTHYLLWIAARHLSFSLGKIDHPHKAMHCAWFEAPFNNRWAKPLYGATIVFVRLCFMFLHFWHKQMINWLNVPNVAALEEEMQMEMMLKPSRTTCPNLDGRCNALTGWNWSKVTVHEQQNGSICGTTNKGNCRAI